MKRLILTLGLLLGATCAFADQVAVSQFKYLNSNDNSITLDPSEAQDLLNVDIRPGGRSVKKREGYGLYKDLALTGAIHGGHHFFDTPGSDVQVWGSSDSLVGIVGDGAPVVIVSSATTGATWDCEDTQGFAYCVNSSRDAYIKTNGLTMNWYGSPTPLGTMVEITPTRAVIAGVSGSASTLYFSEAANFINFTTGIQETSPFTEVIASPGAKITHVRYGCGKLLWWKDQSFGYLTGENQFDLENTIVSDTVGTFDNTSAIDPGGNVWFRGQDGHIWKYDCTALSDESIDITPSINVSGKRTSNYWAQTSQSDFGAGRVSPSAPSTALSTSAVSGSIVVSSFTGVDTSSADFTLGSSSNIWFTSTGIKVSTNNAANVNDYSFETGNIWIGNTYTRVAEQSTDYSCTITPHDGVRMMQTDVCNIGGGTPTGAGPRILLTDVETGTSYGGSENAGTDCADWQTVSVSVPALVGKRVTVHIGNTVTVSSLTLTEPFIYSGETVSFKFRDATNHGAVTCIAKRFVDTVLGGSSTITSGSFTSRSFDTALDSTTLFTEASWTVNDSPIKFSIYTAQAAGGPWTQVSLSSGANTFARRYIRYASTMTAGYGDMVSSLDSVTFVARSSGTYYSDVHNANNLTSWDTFSANQSLDNGSLTYYTRASTNTFTLLSSTPAWVSQSNGSVVSASTGTYFQARIDFGITAATQSPTVNDFTFNWFEGTASDQAYGVYFDNAIWFTVASGVGVSTNNYVFKYDLINQGWTLYNFGSAGFVVQNNNLYFGEVGGDQVFRYGGTTSDNGSAITAFWKSKDYAGTDPFLQNTYEQSDTLWKQNANQTATVTYTLDTSSSTSYTVNLTSSTNSIINHRKLLPGNLGYTSSWKFGDSSATSEWELLGYRFSYKPQPYRPSR